MHIAINSSNWQKEGQVIALNDSIKQILVSSCKNVTSQTSRHDLYLVNSRAKFSRQIPILALKQSVQELQFYLDPSY